MGAGIALLLAAAGTATAVPATAAPVYRCSERADWPDRTENGLVVLNGDLVGDVRVCDVREVHVLGDVHVEGVSHTNLYHSLVEGAVTSVGAVDLIGTTVRGDVRLTGGAGLATKEAQVEGDVHAYGSVILDGTVVAGDVVARTSARQPWVRAVASRIGGDLVADGGAMTVAGVDVGGRTALTRWTSLAVCGGTVAKDMALAAAAGPGQLGPSTSQCIRGRGPRIGGSLLVVHVRPDLTVQGTSVGKDLRCIASPGVVQLSGVSVGRYRDPTCRSR